ncbi:MAG: family 2A encapsulin nanocompartment cargo protein cysteine desulfurase [Terriglobales bacterium]
MSTNITNTNNGNGNGASRPKSNAPKSAAMPGEGTQLYPFASIPLPDPSLLERLANEFFLVMPKDLANGDSGAAAATPEEIESEEIPVTMFSEPLPLRDAPVAGSPSVPTGSPEAAQPGPLSEADLRAIAASLGSAMSLVPGAPTARTSTPVPASQPDLFGEGKISPLAVAPSLPPGNEMFSFPGIAGMPSSAPTAPPGGADANAVPGSTGIVSAAPVATSSVAILSDAERSASPAAAAVLPPMSELFSFPRVPAVPNVSGLPTVPSAPSITSTPFVTPSLSPSVAEPSGSTTPARVPDSDTVPGSVPAVTANEANLPRTPTTGEKAVYPGASVLPSPSELFSFPGVPGVQSPPGVPVLPSGMPTSAPTQANVPVVAGAPMPATEPAKTPASPAPQFEFRPDVIPDLGTTKRPLDPRLIRRDFPILQERVHGRQLIWLDNAATTQKPNAVIDRLSYFYAHENSNIHRAAHDLAARATDAYESAREKARRFLNASSTREVIFVRGTTEGINLVAQSWGRRNVQKDDEIVITWLEHHANIVPWQQLCSEKGARLRVAPVNDRGEIILEEYEKLLNPRTRIVSLSQVSNALGTITPAREMVEMAHRHGACVLVDGAQAVSHMRVDVQALNCDFYVFSGHKVFGPTGIGVVYGKLDVLENTPPWQGGGNMIVDVTFEKTTYQPAPARFEAGTGNIADAVGLGAALDYVEQVGMENIAAYEHELLNYGTAGLLTVPGLRLIGTAREKAGVMSFVLDDMRTEDVGVALNEEGIAVRSGHHCAQPILRRMGVESSVRPSLALYNTCEELDQLVATLIRIQAGRGRGNRAAG